MIHVVFIAWWSLWLLVVIAGVICMRRERQRELMGDDEPSYYREAMGRRDHHRNGRAYSRGEVVKGPFS